MAVALQQRSTSSSSSAKATSSIIDCSSPPKGTCSAEWNFGVSGGGTGSGSSGGGQSSCTVSSADQKLISTTSQSNQGVARKGSLGQSISPSNSSFFYTLSQHPISLQNPISDTGNS